MDVATRNKQVKTILAGLFGKDKVSVTGGRGSAYGWCYINIDAGPRLSNEDTYTQAERDFMNEIRRRAKEALQNVEFYTYTDDMGDDCKERLIQVHLQ